MTERKAADQLLRSITALNKHFAAEDVPPTDAHAAQFGQHFAGCAYAIEIKNDEVTHLLQTPVVAPRWRPG